VVQNILNDEIKLKLDTLLPYQEFAIHAAQIKNDLLHFISNARSQGKLVAALGASTKGNVLLQYCGLTEHDIAFIGEVNEEKYGCFTPGTWIPIIPESIVLSKNPDYLIVLPWHFRSFFQDKERYRLTTLVYPLPSLEVSDYKDRKYL